MSAVSMNVTPASNAACTVETASSWLGKVRSLFIDIGMAPRPIAETVKGPRVRVCMRFTLSDRVGGAGLRPGTHSVRVRLVGGDGGSGRTSHRSQPLPPKLLDLGPG